MVLARGVEVDCGVCCCPPPSPTLSPPGFLSQVLQAQDADAGRVVREQLLAPGRHQAAAGTGSTGAEASQQHPPAAAPVLYAKHMAKHWVGVDRQLLRRARHVLLVRCVCLAPPLQRCAHRTAGGERTGRGLFMLPCHCFLLASLTAGHHTCCALSTRLRPLALPSRCCRNCMPAACREPASVLQSFSDVLEPTLQESCYPALLELYSELRSLGWVGVSRGATE